ncbi:hypothetical protein [Tautonia plasticadhaerens]|uniref:Cytochrome C n=1 Tax=Tautonia plasticadhaerens TaxID=2527974 RepID=A0A518GW50_9BACT|nr:hypothetical protein [Tautonia plasticadhaerens]QDV32823.1 hypothetical protein ElP_06630 [Tautonia plasticadhaerens]
MRRPSNAMTLACLAGAVILSSPVAGRKADDPPPPPIKEIMGKLNNGPQALTSAIGRNLDKAEPNWGTLVEQCEIYVENVEHLGKNTPPRGEPASWKRLTEAYLDCAKTLAKAVEARDRKAALAAHQKIQQACARCHVSHKP